MDKIAKNLIDIIEISRNLIDIDEISKNMDEIAKNIVDNGWNLKKSHW